MRIRFVFLIGNMCWNCKVCLQPISSSFSNCFTCPWRPGCYHPCTDCKQADSLGARLFPHLLALLSHHASHSSALPKCIGSTPCPVFPHSQPFSWMSCPDLAGFGCSWPQQDPAVPVMRCLGSGVSPPTWVMSCNVWDSLPDPLAVLRNRKGLW